MKKKSILAVLFSFSIIFLTCVSTQSSNDFQIPAKTESQTDPPDYFNVPLGVALKNKTAYITDLGNTRIVKIDIQTMNYQGEIPIRDKGKRVSFLLGRPAFDAQDNLWVSDMENGRILKIDKNTGEILFKFGKMGQGSGEFYAPNGLIFDNSGNLWVADELNSRIQKCNANTGMCSISQTYDSGFPQDLAFYQDYLFVCVTWQNKIVQYRISDWKVIREFGSDVLHTPRGIGIDQNGKIYVSDNLNNRIVIFDMNGKVLDYITGLPLSGPAGIKIDNEGNIYSSQGAAHMVLKFQDKKLKGYTGKLRNLNYQLFYPLGADISENEVAICDVMNKRVQIYNLKGIYQKSISGFNFPKAVVYSSNGFIYVADIENTNGIIRVFNSTWESVKTIVFNEMFFPARLVIDKDNFLYATDYLNGKLFKIKTEDSSIAARFEDKQKKLAGLAFHPVSNLLYVIDSQSDQILKFTRNLELQDKWGKHGHNNGEFFGISDLTFDKLGNLWIADSGNFRVQVFDNMDKWKGTIGSLGLTPLHFFGITVLHSNQNYIIDVSSYLNFARIRSLSEIIKNLKIKQFSDYRRISVINKILKTKSVNEKIEKIKILLKRRDIKFEDLQKLLIELERIK